MAAIGQVGGVPSARRRLSRAESTTAARGSRAENAGAAAANDAVAGRRLRVHALEAREQRRERTAHEAHLAAIADTQSRSATEWRSNVKWRWARA